MSYIIRDYQESIDKNFVLTHWFKSRKSGESNFITIEHEIYDRYLYGTIEQTFKSSKTKIACDKENETVIYGFICYDKYYYYPVVHYIFVKQAFRKFKIAKSLVDVAKNEAERQDRLIITYKNKHVNLDHTINLLTDLKLLKEG